METRRQQKATAQQRTTEAILNIFARDDDEVVDVGKFRDQLTQRAVSDEFVNELITKLDADSNGALTKSECRLFLNRWALPTFQADNIDVDEFEKALLSWGIDVKQATGLIKLLDSDGNGTLTNKECNKYLGDRTKFVSLGSKQGYKIKDTALRAIELRQLEKIYDYVESEFRDGCEPWKRPSFVENGVKCTGDWFRGQPSINASDGDIGDWFRQQPAGAASWFRGQSMDVAADDATDDWFRGQPSSNTSDGEIIDWFRQQPAGAATWFRVTKQQQPVRSAEEVNLYDLNGDLSLRMLIAYF